MPSPWILAALLPALVGTTAQAESITLDNGVARVVIEPAIGGRAVSYVGGGRSWLWHDATATPQEPTAEKPWLYGQLGGFHLWPAPQSRWKRANLVGWPPPGQIDHGVYEVVAHDAASVDLRAPVEDHADQAAVGLRSGLRYRLAPHSTRLTVVSSFTNTLAWSQWWSHWQITTVQLPPAHRGCITFPVNPASAAGEQGFLHQVGEKHELDQERSGPLRRIWWNGHQQKVSSDSNAGWLAAEDLSTGTAFVQRFTVTPHLPFGTYPEGNCPVAFYLGADPGFVSPGFTELEVLGAEQEIAPAATTTMTVEWAACRVAGPLLAVTEGGVTVRPLQIAAGRARGSFGVFDVGTATLTIAGSVAWSGPCSPAAPLELDVPVTGTGVATLSVDGRPLSTPPP